MPKSRNAVKRQRQIKLDALDMRLIQKLIENAHATYQEIAEALGVSTGTIHMRLKKLQKLQVIQSVRAYPYPQKIGLQIHAFLGVQIQGPAVPILEKLKEMPHITRIYQVSAPYNFLVEVYARSVEELAEIVKTINGISGTLRVDLIQVLENTLERGLPVFTEGYRIPKPRGPYKKASSK